MLDVVRGVLHMHDLGIVHQDIKSGNVMMTRDYTAKIGDVGLAAVLAFSSSRQSSPGTLEWTAPEVSPQSRLICERLEGVAFTAVHQQSIVC